jgi:hypothetical protein
MERVALRVKDSEAVRDSVVVPQGEPDTVGDAERVRVGLRVKDTLAVRDRLPEGEPEKLALPLCVPLSVSVGVVVNDCEGEEV